MSSKGSIPPASRRSYGPGIGGNSQRTLGAAIYRSPLLNKRKKPTQFQRYSQQTLAVAAGLMRMMTAWEYQTAKDVAGRSGYTWRDQLFAAYFGTGLQFTDTNGLTWLPRRELALNIQQLLDSISSAVGAVLVRTSNGWATLLPGTNNYVFTIDPTTSLPNWLPPQAGSSGNARALATSSAFAPPVMALKGTATFSSGNFGARSLFLPQGAIVSKLRLVATAAAATAKLTPAIYGQTLGTANALLAQGAQVTGAVQGLNDLPISFISPADNWYYCGFQCLTASVNLAPAASIIDDFFFASTTALPSSAPTGTYNSGAAWQSFFLG